MKFENRFTVAAPPERLWEALMDFERVVPCMPGAELLEHSGDDSYQVRVKVKVGPMTMTYRGSVEVTERDEAALTAAMRAQARETRGQGTANATVQIKLSPLPGGSGGDGSGTEAAIDTDLRLSGRAASMGRGVIGDVAQALISQFADNLQELLSASSSGAAERSPPPSSPSPQGPAPALDAGELARSVVANRLRAPLTALLAGLLLGFVLGRWRRR